MRAAKRAALGGLLLATALGCQHDLAALQVDNDMQTPLRDGGGSGSGKGGSSGGSSGGSGMSSSGSGGMDLPHPQSKPCEPCTEPSTAAKALGLTTCCYGVRNNQCGLNFGTADVCLPPAVPGQSNDVCPSVKKGILDLKGCCRPDSRCGFMATSLGLGCAAREEVPASVVGTIKPIACDYTCAVDADCSVLAGGHVCAEDPTDATRRICVHSCQRDSECAQDKVCALTNDKAMNRVLAFCQAPLTDVGPGENCSKAEDCAQGVCLMNIAVCTQLCRVITDCPKERPRCVKAGIDRPNHMGTMQDFDICLP